MGKPRDIDREAREFSRRLRRLMADWARDRVVTGRGVKFADAMKAFEDAPYSLQDCLTVLANTYCDANEVMLEALVACGHASEDTADWHGFAGPVFERAWEMKYYRDDGV